MLFVVLYTIDNKVIKVGAKVAALHIAKSFVMRLCSESPCNLLRARARDIGPSSPPSEILQVSRALDSLAEADCTLSNVCVDVARYLNAVAAVQHARWRYKLCQLIIQRARGEDDAAYYSLQLEGLRRQCTEAMQTYNDLYNSLS